MSARVIRLDPKHIDAGAITEAADILRGGGLVAFPTETVYGLGANALDERAVNNIFSAKGRPAENPLIVHVADAATARELSSDWPAAADQLAGAFWPGPLTLVVPKKPTVSNLVTAGLDTVAVRVPAHPVALALIRATELPLAAPSANPSGAVSPTTAEHVRRGLGDRVDLILDGGATEIGIESTVVDVTGERPMILRPGMISAEAVEKVVGPVDRLRAAPASVEAGTVDKGEARAPRSSASLGESSSSRGQTPASPGLLGRHYAPRAELHVFPTGEGERAAEAAREAKRQGRRVGVVAFGPLAVSEVRTTIMARNPTAYARRLYSALHEMDDSGRDVVFIEEVPDDLAWGAIRDRIRRASSMGRS